MKRVEPGERAALYYRVSTEEQERVGYSLDAQREALVKFAAENKLKVIGEFPDGGFSARKKWTTRPAFVELLETVQRNEIDVILFIKLDRWFRNVADYYEVQKILDEHKVRWVAIMEDYDTTTANGRLALNIKLSIAQDEADRTSERIKFVFADKLRRGEVISGNLPLGFTIVDKKPCVNDDADFVREIFEHYIGSRSIAETTRWMRNEKNKPITQPGIQKILTNRKYIGEWNGIAGFSEPIIDDDTFNIAQEILTLRSQRNSTSPRIYLFSGLVFCGCCGKRLTTHSSAYNGKRNMYYICANHQKYKTCENRRLINEEAIEKYLLAHILAEVERHNLEIEQHSQKPKPDNTQAIKRKMERLKDLYINDLLDIDAYKTSYNELQRAYEEEQRKRDIVNRVIPLSAVETPMSAYDSFSRQAKKAFWSTLISRIYVNNDKEISFDLRLP